METVFFHYKIRFYSHLLNQTIYFDYLNHYKMTFLMPDEKSNINSYTECQTLTWILIETQFR